MSWHCKPAALIDEVGLLWCAECAKVFGKGTPDILADETHADEPCDGCGRKPVDVVGLEKVQKNS